MPAVPPSSPRALLLGLGRFGGGAAAARFLVGRGYRVRIADRASADQLRGSVATLRDVPRLEFCLGRADLGLLDDIELLVCNPAIPPGHPLLRVADERGLAVTQEANLFLEAYEGQVVVITGTNGKSTTATLLAAALRRSGVDTLLGGNIGHSLLDDCATWRRDQVAVLELSSFQLERVEPARHRVTGAVFSRITSDHLDRHRTLAAYHAAKARAAAMADDFVIHLADDPVAGAMRHRAAETIRCGQASARQSGANAVELRGTTIWSCSGPDVGPILDTSALTLPGTFQADNAMAACTAALRLGVPRHPCALAIALATPLPHRLQLTASIDGVNIVDNAVSTHIESTMSALDTLASGGRFAGRGQVHWVGGGKSKDGRFVTPGQELSDKVHSAHLFGSAAANLGRVLADRVTTTIHDRLEEALDAAWAASHAGDTILFSPAFASFDQFANFQARARRFDGWVRDLRLHGGQSRRTRQVTAAGDSALANP